MARNSEKAQSMLYRFRESQAIEMGLGNRMKGDRRPRMASSVSSLRECERWRGDILKDVSRKVSKIQDATLTDYEIRDLNDEINGLMREKRHWETQIVALGGANYKRAQAAMVDDEGKEVPGTRGYKYFGRAKELPGVKEMFTKGAQQATEESARNASFQMFRNQGPDYYGDNDEMDGALAEEEEELAKRGERLVQRDKGPAELSSADWDAAALRTAKTLSLDESAALPSFPSSRIIPSAEKSSAPVEVEAGPAKPTPKKGGKKSKRKAGPNVVEEEEEGAKKARTATGDGAGEVAAPNGNGGVEDMSDAHRYQTALALAASFLGVLDPESLKMPRVPSAEEMGKILLEVRKKALMEEYGV